MGLWDVLKRDKKKAEGKKGQQPFTYVVQDIFTLKSQGTVVVGVVKGGPVHVGDPVYILKRRRQFLQAVVAAIEKPGGRMEEALPGANVALMFREVCPSQLEKGDVVSNLPPSPSYGDGWENPRLRGLLADRGYTILENLEGYIREEIDLYPKVETGPGEEPEKGGAELPHK